MITPKTRSTAQKYIIFLMAIIFFLPSCKKESVEIDTALDIRIKRDPERLNPIIYPSSVAREVFQYIFLALADFDPESLQLRPVLINEIPEKEKIMEGPYEGGLSFEYEIVEEASWPDGKPITGLDYAFTVKAVNNKDVNAAAYRSYLKEISDVVVDPDNPKRFEVIVGRDYMLALEATATLQVYPAHIYDPANAMALLSISHLKDDANYELWRTDSIFNSFVSDFNSAKYSREIVVGSGPYKLSEWTTNQWISLERVPDYWAKDIDNPFLVADCEKLNFHILPDETSAMTLLKSGELDLLAGISSQNFNKIRSEATSEADFDFFTPQLMRYYYVAINHRSPKLKERSVRKALVHLTDVGSMIETLEAGIGNQTIGHFHPSKPYYNDGIDPPIFDPSISKTILDEAGWTDSNNNGILDKKIDGQLEELELTIHVSPGQLGKNVALMLKQEAAKVGINIEVSQKEFQLIRKENLSTRNFELVTMVHTADASTDDPYNKYHSNNIIKGGKNDIGYANPEADLLIEAIRIENDSDKRNTLFKQLQQVMSEDYPVIFLWTPSEKIIVREAFEGSGTSKRPGYLANTFKPTG